MPQRTHFHASPSVKQFAGQRLRYVISMSSRVGNLRYGKFCLVLIVPASSSDDFTVGFFLLFLVAASLGMGQSFPRSWNYVAADATALVGIEWQHLHDSFLADAVTSELS